MVAQFGSCAERGEQLHAEEPDVDRREQRTVLHLLQRTLSRRTVAGQERVVELAQDPTDRPWQFSVSLGGKAPTGSEPLDVRSRLLLPPRSDLDPRHHGTG